ncbi:MAG: M12 family metallopeptidase [Bacteroidia bacterium]
MKKQLLLSLLFLFLVNKNLWAQTTFTIPDVNFFNAVMTFGNLKNSSGSAPTCSSCVTNYSTRTMNKSCIDNLDIVEMRIPNKQIADLQGIEHFTDLKTLECNNNQLTNLASLPTNLIHLVCFENNITILPPLPNSLTHLLCRANQITSLPPLPNNLKHLDCQVNQLTSLPPLPNSLLELYCGINSLTNLPILPSNLEWFGCHYNQLTNLPTLSNSLIYLRCDNNPLTILPPLPSSLTDLLCYNTYLTCFPDISYITSNLTIQISNTLITCLPNLPVNINVTPLGLPLCTDNYVSPCHLYASYGTETFPPNSPRKVEATVIDMPFTTLPNDPILYERVNFQNQDWAVFGSDIMLCPMNQLNTFQAGTWQGKIPYDASNVYNVDSVMKAINYWNVRAGLMGLHIAFVPKQAGDTQWVKFFDTPNAYASRLGRVIGATEQEVWVDFQGYSGRILHELGHTAGLYHEHQRWDRDNYVNIAMNEVRAEYADNYCKLHDIQATPFDYQSLMHHWCYAFSETPPIDGINIDTSDFKKTIIPLYPLGEGVIMGQRADFTPYDIQDFNQLYPTGIIGGIGPTGSGTYTLELDTAYQNLTGLTVTWSVSSSYIPPNGTAISATQNSTNPLKADVLAPQPTGSTTAARGFVIATIAHPSFGTKSYYKYVFRN